MRYLIVPLIALFALTSCFEDKEAILAECRLKYDKNGDGQEGVLLCMSAKGYEFESGWTDDKFTMLNTKCWDGKIINGTGVPVTPWYILTDCYNKRPLWTVLKHNY